MKIALPLLIFLTACGSSGALASSPSPDAGPDAASSPSSPSDAATAASDTSPAVVVPACAELGSRALTSIDDVKAALRASPAFPYPGGWETCEQNVSAICPLEASPALSFNEAFTEASCGQNSEGGYRSAIKFAMNVREVSPPPSGGGGTYAIDLTLDAGVASYEVKALRDASSGRVGLALIDTATSAKTVFQPLQHLP